MELRTRFPRPVRYAVFGTLVLLSSTFVLAHNPAASDSDPVAAAQWRAGGPQIQLQGQIEIVRQDFRNGQGKYVYTLKQADGTRVPMHFVKNPPTRLLTGDKVTASGQQSSSGLILYSGGNVKNSGGGSSGGGTTTSSIPLPNTFGSQSVLVILVNFQDDVVEPYTAAEAQTAFFGGGNSATNFTLENSYGQTSLTGAVVGWYTIPASVTTCDTSQIASYAQNAATAAGVPLSNYSRYVYLFPQDNACGFGGASTIGGNPSQSWLNGTLDPAVINHELGHAFGLWHSHSLDCGSTAVICSGGTTVEYGDQMDVMGTVQTAAPDYNAFQKEQLGWLNYSASPSIQTVTTSGSYTLSPYENGPGPNALKVLQSIDATTGARTWYYLESRQAIGSDAFLMNWPYSITQNITTGVLLHLGTEGNGNSSLMLNLSPATPTYDFEMALPVGQSFQDSVAGLSFTPTAVSGSGATVQIAMSGSSCTPANPTVTVSPLQSLGVTSGTAVNFTATVTDNDSSGCSGATFNLGNSLPAGWTGSWSAPTLSLSPGKSGSATLMVTSPVGTADGSYNVSVNAVNASATSYNGSAVATYAIATPASLSVSLWTDQSSYVPGQTVAIRVSLLYGAVPDVGASVTVTVTSPKGRTTTLTGTTGSTGMASLSYKLGRNAPAGTYIVQYGTSVAGAASTMGASTSFSVQ